MFWLWNTPVLSTFIRSRLCENSDFEQQRTFTSRRKGCELTLMAGNVATLHAAPLPTNVASMKSMVADSSIQVRWGGWRAAAGISVRRVSKEGSNNGAMAPR